MTYHKFCDSFPVFKTILQHLYRLYYCSWGGYWPTPLRLDLALCFGQQNEYTRHTSYVSRGYICAWRVWLGLPCFCCEKEQAAGRATPSPGTQNRIGMPYGDLEQTRHL